GFRPEPLGDSGLHPRFAGFAICDACHGPGSQGETAMNGAVSPSPLARFPLETPPTVATRLFIAAGIATVILFVIFPREAAHGWLIAFAVFSQIALGSLALLLIDSLTGTRWGKAFGGVLRSFLLGIPLSAIFWLLIAFNLRTIYPWAASPETIPPDVAQIY